MPLFTNSSLILASKIRKKNRLLRKTKSALPSSFQKLPAQELRGTAVNQQDRRSETIPLAAATSWCKNFPRAFGRLLVITPNYISSAFLYMCVNITGFSLRNFSCMICRWTNRNLFIETRAFGCLSDTKTTSQSSGASILMSSILRPL